MGKISQGSNEQTKFNRSRPINRETKVFNDPIHGHIELDPVYIDIIDTPEFQRLRNLKQLGAVNFVYPGAVHTRFEHSIGTCYLALKMVRHLKETNKDLEITKEDELCVGLAALCHDLGHGPFSHLFDRIFIPQFKPKEHEDWSHELGSIKIFDSMVVKYDLKNRFSEYDYELDKNHFHFIKEMIYGPLEKNTTGYKKAEYGKYKAKDPDEYFFYEIVSNKTNEIDVDKWDYFARDSYYLGVRSNFIHERFIKFAKVLKVQNETEKTQICFRDKEALSVYEMFHTRYRLYSMACYHPVVIGVEAMITDALLAAGEYLELTKSDKTSFKLPDAITDMDAYQLLDDNILTLILHSYSKPNLDEARKILERIQKRELYKLVRKMSLRSGHKPDKEDEIIEGIIGEANDGTLIADDLFVKIVNMDYGMKERNPVDCVLFFSKDKPDVPKPIPREEISHLLPQTFQERFLYIYVKDGSKKDIAAKCIDQWRAKTEWLQQPREVKDDENERTPQRERGVPSAPVRQSKRPRGDDGDIEGVKKKLFKDKE